MEKVCLSTIFLHYNKLKHGMFSLDVRYANPLMTVVCNGVKCKYLKTEEIHHISRLVYLEKIKRLNPILL